MATGVEFPYYLISTGLVDPTKMPSLGCPRKIIIATVTFILFLFTSGRLQEVMQIEIDFNLF